MSRRNWLLPALYLMAILFSGQVARAASCVYKVTSNDGHVLYLGGSFHALRPTDYPLPAQYNGAFDASTRIVFEDDPKGGAAAFQALLKAGQYRKGDSLKNHVDPRTYDYLRRFFALRGVAEDKYDRLKPWLLDLILSSPPPEYYELGVEQFLTKRAKATSKPIFGLESNKEHNNVFAGLNDRQAEALLLTMFINAGRDDTKGPNMFEAWRRGNIELLAETTADSFRDFPYIATRLLGARNHNWIPKIEDFLRSGQTYFVVVGAAHLGGPDGVVSLLKSRGYQLQQL
jgi:uncharacterized protein YbaP (TraB family)